MTLSHTYLNRRKRGKESVRESSDISFTPLLNLKKMPSLRLIWLWCLLLTLTRCLLRHSSHCDSPQHPTTHVRKCPAPTVKEGVPGEEEGRDEVAEAPAGDVESRAIVRN